MGALKRERLATGFLRLLPDFLIIGAAKSGTTFGAEPPLVIT